MRVVLRLLLEPDVLLEIDRRCGGPAAGTGKPGGRAHWVRQLIYREVQRTPPDYHAAHEDPGVAGRRLIEKALAREDLTEAQRLVGTLRLQNYACAGIARLLRKQSQILGKTHINWTRARVSKLLTSLLRSGEAAEMDEALNKPFAAFLVGEEK